MQLLSLTVVSLRVFLFTTFLLLPRACLSSQQFKLKSQDAMSWKNLAALTLALSLLSGCSVIERLVYRIDINQGNYLEATDVDRLRFGMNKEQVRFVLGSPMLVEPSYPNTWYYVYYKQPGHEESIQKNLILTFDDQNLLIGMTGDYQPGPNFMDAMN